MQDTMIALPHVQWEDLPEEQKSAAISYFKSIFPDHVNMFVVLDAEINLPLSICTTRERAIDIAENIIKTKFKGIPYIVGDEEESRVRIHKVSMNNEIDEALFDFDVSCWESLK